jgi:hypothetical protein
MAGGDVTMDGLLFHDDKPWCMVKDGNPIGLDLYLRHYSCYHYKDERERRLFCGLGKKIVLLSVDDTALFVWKKFIDDSGQIGVYCAVFRNEGKMKSSYLILEAMKIARKFWPRERFYTYVNPKKIKSTNPGYCFLMAGWKKCGKTKKGLIIMDYTGEFYGE